MGELSNILTFCCSKKYTGKTFMYFFKVKLRRQNLARKGGALLSLAFVVCKVSYFFKGETSFFLQRA